MDARVLEFNRRVIGAPGVAEWRSIHLCHMNIPCPDCKTAVSVEKFLNHCGSYWPNLNIVRYTCPLCHQATEAQIGTGHVWFGYSYAAGQPHFAAMERVKVSGLVARIEHDSLAVMYGNGRWLFTSEPPKSRHGTGR